jgi:hypothetical protein
MPPLKSERFPGRTLEIEKKLLEHKESLMTSLGQQMEELMDKAKLRNQPEGKYAETEKAEYQTEDQVGTDQYTRAWLNGLEYGPTVPIIVTSVVVKDEKGEVILEGNEVGHFGVNNRTGQIRTNLYQSLTLEETVALLEAGKETIGLIEAAQDRRQSLAA